MNQSEGKRKNEKQKTTIKAKSEKNFMIRKSQ